MGVVGGEDGPDHHQDVADPTITQGIRDGHRGIAGAESFIPHVGMGDGLVEGGRVGREGHHLEPAGRIVDFELGEFDLDPEGSQLKPFEDDGIGHHGEHAGLRVQAAFIELVKELAEFLMDQPQGRWVRGHFAHRPFAVAEGILQLAEGSPYLTADLVAGMGPLARRANTQHGRLVRQRIGTAPQPDEFIDQRVGWVVIRAGQGPMDLDRPSGES